MIKARSVYDANRVEKMAKGIRLKTLTTSSLLTVCILIMGVFNIVSSIRGGVKGNLTMLALGIIITLFSIYPMYSALRSVKGIVKKNYFRNGRSKWQNGNRISF